MDLVSNIFPGLNSTPEVSCNVEPCFVSIIHYFSSNVDAVVIVLKPIGKGVLNRVIK